MEGSGACGPRSQCHARHRPGIAAPAIRRPLPGGNGERLLKLAHLEGERLVTVEGKARPVEDQFVLPAELVGEYQRQTGLDHLTQYHLVADIDLAAIIGRTIGHQQDFGAGLGQRLANAEIVPDFLADRHADSHTAEVDRPRHFALDEDPFLVEFAVVRQIDLVAEGEDAAAVEDRYGIVAALFAPARKADDHARTAIGGVSCERFDGLQAGLEESRFQHEILRRITGNEQLGQQQQIGSLASSICAGRPGLRQVTHDIANGGIELRNGNPQDVRHFQFFAHGLDLAAL